MRLPRVRFTVRRMMGAVALAGLILGAIAEYPKAMRRRAAYQAEARRQASILQWVRHARAMEALSLTFWASKATARARRARGEAVPDEGPPPRAGETWASLAEQARQQADWHARSIAGFEREAARHAGLRRRWERAAAFPWLQGEADRPPP